MMLADPDNFLAHFELFHSWQFGDFSDVMIIIHVQTNDINQNLVWAQHINISYICKKDQIKMTEM